MKRGVVFNSDHLENFLITSQNVMDLSIGILFFQESPGNSTSTLLQWIGPGYRMEQPNIPRNSCTQQEDNNEYQLSFQGNSKNERKF